MIIPNATLYEYLHYHCGIKNSDAILIEMAQRMGCVKHLCNVIDSLYSNRKYNKVRVFDNVIAWEKCYRFPMMVISQ